MSPGINLPFYEQAIAYLHSRIDYERAAVIPYGVRDFKLDRMRDLLRQVGDPQHRFPIVHVAGTKGKGSTAAMIAAVLTAAGYRTGLFTSPHLHSVEERIRLDGGMCQPEELAALVAQVQPAVQQLDQAAAADDPAGRGPTYFEITTAMALMHFAAERVDAAVLEVGLGGRLDSTNVCEPIASVITSISYDHMRQLGNTLEAIAWEKAGIVKPGVAAISGVTSEGPRRVIEKVCSERGSPLIQLGADYDFDYFPPQGLESAAATGSIDLRYSVSGHEHNLRQVQIGLLGRHQGANAAVALATLFELCRQGWNLPEAALRRGLANLAWPARVEVVGRSPTVILDAAHNVASVAALLETLAESFQARRRILVFATTRDKDIGGMLALLLPRFDTVILTRYANNPRGVPAAELCELADQAGGGAHIVCEDTAAAWEHVRRIQTPEDLVCITGSFFLAAEMRQQIEERPLAARLAVANAPPVAIV